MPCKYSFDDHPDHKAQLDAWRQRWIDNAFSTRPPDWPKVVEAVEGLYRAADLAPPPRHRIISVRSPLTGAIAAGVAAGVWWLREHPDRHVELFGRHLSETDLMVGLRVACVHAVRHGMARLIGDRPTDVATDEATRLATRVATGVATRAATGVATYEATYEATRLATYAATDVATDEATRVATSVATDVATSLATYAATDEATDEATRVATDVATSLATRAATRAATDVATDEATRLATSVATRAATRAATFLVQCTAKAWRMRDGGSDWSGWPAYLSFFRWVAKLDLPEYSKWQHYETLATEAESRYMHPRFCIVSDRQTSNCRDAQNRLHSEHGPARTWADGWALWYWHGVRVPRSLIEGGGWSVSDILAEPNAEVRRCAIERMGWPEFVAAAGLRQVGESAPDPGNPGQTLTLYDVPDQVYGTRIRVLLCVNGTPERDGTRRRFGLTVPDDVDDPVTAAAWTYGRTRDEYLSVARRT